MVNWCLFDQGLVHFERMPGSNLAAASSSRRQVPTCRYWHIKWRTDHYQTLCHIPSWEKQSHAHIYRILTVYGNSGQNAMGHYSNTLSSGTQPTKNNSTSLFCDPSPIYPLLLPNLLRSPDLSHERAFLSTLSVIKLSYTTELLPDSLSCLCAPISSLCPM